MNNIERVQNWFGRQQERKKQNKQTREQLKQVRTDVAQLVDQIYNTQPVWQNGTRYICSEGNIFWPTQVTFSARFTQLATFYSEFAEGKLSSIHIERNIKPSFLKTRKLYINLAFFSFVGDEIDLEINFSNRSKIKSSCVRQAGPATFTDKKENKEGGIVGETLRLNLIKEVLLEILDLKQGAKVRSLESS